MKRLFIFIFFTLFLFSCSKTIIKTGAISEQNIINISSLQVGMTQNKVLNIMGCPYKIERKRADNKMYEVWYYVTEPILLGQTELVTKNFTPLIFEKNCLKGWGRNYYKFIFDIDNEKWKRQMEKKQEYTDDKEEWPRNEHTMIPSMNEPKKEALDQKEDINKEILELEKPESKVQEKTQEIQKQMPIKKPTDKTMPPNKSQKEKITNENDSKKIPNTEKQDKLKENVEKDKKDSIDSRCKKAKDEKDSYIFWE